MSTSPTTSTPTTDNRRIARNAITLYIRMMFTMVLNLLATRFTLQALGVEEMGVYGVVGGLVSIFGMVTSGLTSAVQRFITFEMGKPGGDVRKVFTTSLNLILGMTALMFLLMEVGGNLMLTYAVNVPASSMAAARWVMQYSIVACVLNVFSVTYNALIIAHERMGVWAAISIVQVALTCLGAYGLTQVPSHHLVLYGLLMMSVQAIVLLLYVLYCRSHFPESSHSWQVDRPLAREIARFAGASYTGNLLYVGYYQGLMLVINWTFGVAMNAVYNIAMQVRNSVLSFGMNVYKAFSPQITKTYAAGETEQHCRLVYTSSKLGAYMVLLIFIPFILRARQVMTLWLGEVPQYAVEFTVACVFQSVLYAGFEPFRSAVFATGRVGRFIIYSETFHLMVVPTGYCVARLTGHPLPFIITVVAYEFLFCGYMMWLGTRVSPISIRHFALKVVLPCLVVLTISTTLGHLLGHLIPQTLVGLLIFVVLSVLLTMLTMLLAGTTPEERQLVVRLIKKLRR